MKILPYTDLMSHPNKKLENHLKNVADFSYDVFNFLEIENKEFNVPENTTKIGVNA